MHAVDTWIYGRNVEGLPEQWWWYDPFAHELVAASSARQSTPPWSGDCPVHIILTAHHERVSWKYGAVAHSLEQKDVGVIMHAIQLASVALGMGAWIIGASDAAGIGTMLGVDIEVDVPLGELAVGVVTG
jgi:SagB-type dehydrogenase family enzyme